MTGAGGGAPAVGLGPGGWEADGNIWMLLKWVADSNLDLERSVLRPLCPEYRGTWGVRVLKPRVMRRSYSLGEGCFLEEMAEISPAIFEGKSRWPVALLKKYEDNYILRALIELLPCGVGGFINSILVGYLNQVRQERLDAFFAELATGRLVLTEEEMQKEDFLHKYLITVRAVLDTRRREKIKLLARLFRNGACRLEPLEVDTYEEYLSILDDLSYRELGILVMLYQYEQDYPKREGENDLQRANRFWGQFKDGVASQLGIEANEIDAMLMRLTRSGLYELFTGNYYGYTGGQGKTTPLLGKLLYLVDLK